MEENKQIPKPEDLIKRGEGNFYHCTDYEDAIDAMKKYASLISQEKEREIQKLKSELGLEEIHSRQKTDQVKVLEEVLEDRDKRIKELEEENEVLKVKVSWCDDEIDRQDKRIKELEEKFKTQREITKRTNKDYNKVAEELSELKAKLSEKEGKE